MNQFGGNWTEAKMEMVVSYARAYLTIMNKNEWIKTIYFDGFAGSGLIENNEGGDVIKGTALRILDIDDRKPFDLYYFVEKEEKFKLTLEENINKDYPERKTRVVQADCNEKLVAMAKYLTNNKSYRALAFIDPYGMTVNWSSIEALKGLGVDFWILVPTGLGVSRLLKNDGQISDSWLLKLEKFLGLPRQYIIDHFYKKENINTLFGEVTQTNKEKNIVDKIGQLYSERLRTVFEFVSESFVMRNSNNSIMYHFMMATNNAAALNIANAVVKPKYKL
jgi:three-Cys-motif partner protein